MKTVTVTYNSSVNTAAGWRSVEIKAVIEMKTAKTGVVKEVLTIDGDEPSQQMSRTGANRQKYNGVYFANAEIGKKKRISSCCVCE